MPASLLLDIDFANGGNSAAHLLEGWGAQEPNARWTLGRQSSLALRLPADAAGSVLVLCATPCVDRPVLARQGVMLALNDRLLATASFHEKQVAAFRLPPGLPRDVVLSIVHLHCDVPRAASRQRHGLPLGLMMHSVRLFSAGERADRIGNPSVSGDAELAMQFESIGQGCHFGLIQRQCGAEPLGLLRFVDTMTALLYEGLAQGFSGIDAPGQLEMQVTDQSRPTYRWRHRGFGLMFDTRAYVDETDPVELARAQSARLGFLRRKFLEDCRDARKIFVLTRGDCLTEAEALAVFCALRLHGDCTLLWTVFGDPARAGQIDEIAPGFLRGELGQIDQERYATLQSWRQLMQSAIG